MGLSLAGQIRGQPFCTCEIWHIYSNTGDACCFSSALARWCKAGALWTGMPPHTLAQVQLFPTSPMMCTFHHAHVQLTFQVLGWTDMPQHSTDRHASFGLSGCRIPPGEQR